jgi:hypothetical protein
VKKLPIYLFLTATLSFALGYYLRWVVSSQPADSASVHAESRSEADDLVSGDASPLIGTDLAQLNDIETGGRQQNSEAPIAQTPPANSMNAYLNDPEFQRHQHIQSTTEWLSEFFSILGIGPTQTDEIIQSLVDLDLRRPSDMAALGIQGVFNNPDASEDEKRVAEQGLERLRANWESDRRAILGGYYDAYIEYIETYPQRVSVNRYSASLSEPLYASTKDELLRIFIEESKRPEGRANRWTLAKRDKKEMMASMQENVDVTRARNKRIETRARPYLNEEQYQELVESLNNEVARIEIMIRYEQLTPTR